MRVRERGRLYATLPVLMAALLAACARPSPPLPPDPEIGMEEPYVIGPADALHISTWKNPELTQGVVVRPDGKISVPLLDDVQAAGLTPLELKEVLSESLREYVEAPDVTVVVTQVNSKRAFVTGEGARSVVVPLQRDTRVLAAIISAGGFTTFANKKNVKVLRRTKDGLIEYHFDYEAYVDGRAPDSNILLQDGDTIVVP
jgi:polysaccharide export outer membrane protein